MLPRHSRLDIPALSGLFKSTTNSYKYLFFLSILNELKRHQWKPDQPKIIPLNDLAVEMALLSWYPLKFFNLSFGSQDQVVKVIDRLEFPISNKTITSSTGIEQLRAALQKQGREIGLYALLKYVPYRLQSVFFSSQLRGVVDHKKDDMIADLAQTYFTDTVPLYRYAQSDKQPCIELHSEWYDYLFTEGNINIVENWALLEWVRFLQVRNPNTPAIINKVVPPTKRASLKNQADYWKVVIGKDPSFKCIYTGEKLSNQPFALDHFLPWTFVCHDQPWNLCPVNSSANSSKGNRLPADVYIERFISQQHKALEVSLDEIGLKKWNKFVEPYAIDLRLAPELLLDECSLFEAYSGVLNPMLALAKQTGFEKNWEYQNK